MLLLDGTCCLSAVFVHSFVSVLPLGILEPGFLRNSCGILERDLPKWAEMLWKGCFTVLGGRGNKMSIADLRILFDCVALACGESFLLSPLFNDDVKYRPCFDFMAHDRTQESISVTSPFSCL